MNQNHRVLGRFRSWIAEGTWAPGQRIPSERDLAKRLGVNRKAVHTTLQVLEREGAIEATSPRIRVVTKDADGGSAGLYHTVVMLSDVADAEAAHANPEIGQGTVLGILESIQAAGLTPLVIDPKQVDADALRQLVAQRPRGAILLKEVPRERLGGTIAATLLEAGIPVAAYADVLTAAELASTRFDRVRSDQAAGSASLVRWLHRRGRRRILRCWDNRELERIPAWRAERDRGVVETCAELGLPTPGAVEFFKLEVGQHPPRRDFERHVRMVAGFLYEHLHGPEPADALMALSDKPASYVHAACRLLGREPGRDVTIVGYDDVWRGFGERDFVGCPVEATVRKDMAGIGAHLVELLQRRVAGELPAEPQVRVVIPELIVTDPS